VKISLHRRIKKETVPTTRLSLGKTGGGFSFLGGRTSASTEKGEILQKGYHERDDARSTGTRELQARERGIMCILGVGPVPAEEGKEISTPVSSNWGSDAVGR